MWVCLSNSFLSIVHKDCKPDELLVRARRPGDIERAFPGVEIDVREVDGTDYQFRATVQRRVVAEALSSAVLGIQYDNFKNSVKDHKLHDAYAAFWHEHARLQPRRPYARRAAAPVKAAAKPAPARRRTDKQSA